MILRWKKIRQRIDKGELVHCYWSERYKALTFVFCNAPVVVRTRRKKIVNTWERATVM